MNSTKRIVLLTCVSPILFILVLSLFNINKSVRLKFLTWTSPPVSLGILMTVGSLSSAIFSASTVLSLGSENYSFRRELHIDPNLLTDNDNKPPELDNDHEYTKERFGSNNNVDNYMPERDVRDPSPTVSVPFRIVSLNTSTNNKSSQSNIKQQSYESDEYYEENYSTDQTKIDSIPLSDDDLNNTTQAITDDWGLNSGENW